MDHKTEQDAGQLEQAATMLEERAEEQRTQGNCSAAEGAACSAHAIRRLAPALLRAGRGCLAQIEEPAQHTRIVLDDRWKARMLDGRAIERDEMGLGDHPELPMLDEGMMPRSFFAALGLELAHTSAEDQLDGEVLGAMSEAVNWTDWLPTPPHGDGWKLVSMFDTEDGPVAWWLRELPEAEDGTTTIRNLQAEVEKLEARIARIARAGAATAAVAPQGDYPQLPKHVTAYYDDVDHMEVRCFSESQMHAYFDLGRQPAAAPALEAPAAPACDEEAAYKKWFQGEQGKPYHTMWDFARAAWMARATPASTVAAALIRLDAIYREEADCDEPPQRPDWLVNALHLAAAAPQAPTQEAPAAPESLIAAAKAFYNGTVVDPKIKISATCPDARDHVKHLGERLREEIQAITAAAPQAPAAPVHSKTYSDGTVATGSGELPAQSPQQQVLCTLLDTVEAMLGGANGPTIQIRAALLAAPAAPAVDALSQAARDVLAERRRQVEAEGYDTEHDDAHVMGEIGALAALYLMPDGARDWDTTSTTYGATLAQALLPEDWTMPTMGEDRRRDLVKGIACGLAELERWDRASAQTNGGNAT